MRHYKTKSEGRIATMAAALAVTLALLSLVDQLFAPMATSFAAHVHAANVHHTPVEVAIVPSRIEVVAKRLAQVAGNAPMSPPARPDS